MCGEAKGEGKRRENNAQKLSEPGYNLKAEAQRLIGVECERKERKGKDGFFISCDGTGWRSSSFW